MKVKKIYNVGEGDFIGLAFQLFFFESRPHMYLISMWHYLLPILYVSLPHSPTGPVTATLLWGLVFMALFEAPSNVWNAVNDVVEDVVNKPFQFIAAGVYPADMAEKMAFAFWAILVALAAYLGFLVGRWQIPVLTLIAIAFSFIYSDKKYTKLRIKGRHIFASLAALVGFTALFAAPVYLLTGKVFTDPLLCSVLLWIGFQYAALMVLKDYFDTAGDRKSGLRTLPIISLKLADAVFTAYLAVSTLFAVYAFLVGAGWPALVFGAGFNVLGYLLFARFRLTGVKHYAYQVFVLTKVLAPVLWAISLFLPW